MACLIVLKPMPELCANALEHCCKLTTFQYDKVRAIYSKILGTDRTPKIARGWQIQLTNREYWKQIIVKYITKEPRYINTIIGMCTGKRSIGCQFPYDFNLQLVLELIEDGKIMPIEILTRPSQIVERAMKTGHYKSIKEYRKYNTPLKIGAFLNFGKEYIYNGVNLCKCYDFKLIKT